MPSSPLLVLEASTTVGSVALLRDGGAVSARVVQMGASREDTMLPAIDALCREANITVGDIRTVVCGAGPGSFTSLRIAASIAKGIVHANRLLRSDAVELYAVPSLLFAAAAIEAPGEYLVHADAMRGERFVQRVRISVSGRVQPVGATYRASLRELSALSDGDKEQTVRNVSVVTSVPGSNDGLIVAPAADQLFRIDDWQSAGPVNLLQWEPTYGRLAEAQVKWEATHGTSLPVPVPG